MTNIFAWPQLKARIFSRTFFVVVLLIAMFDRPLSVVGGEFDLTVMVPAGTHQCYFQTVQEKHKTIELDYQVVDGGDLDVNFMLMLGAKVLVQDEKKTDNTHRVESPEAGEYQICFDNSFSYQSRKIVWFEVYLYDANGTLEEEDITKYARQDPALQKQLDEIGMTVNQFHESFGRTKQLLNKVEFYQTQVRAFDARDRSISIAQNDRVLFWSIANTVVMLFAAGLQVYLIRSLFEEKSSIGRMLRK